MRTAVATLFDTPVSSDSALDEVFDFLALRPDLGKQIGRALRNAFDEVIDGQRTGRYRIEQLEKTEKTYIGTKVEIVLRSELELERGRVLDNLICGHEVDTKFSLKGGWMIPREAFGQLCILVKANDNTAKFSLGLLRMTPDVLRNSRNQDKKGSVSAHGATKIRWLFHEHPMEPNFLLKLSPRDREEILGQQSGVQRIKSLFMNVTGQLIPRSAILQVAQQKDSLKRAREQKARLLPLGRLVLCATYLEDREEMRRRGYPPPEGDECWVSLKT